MKNPKFTLIIILCISCIFPKTEMFAECTLVCNSEMQRYYSAGTTVNITSDEILNDFLEIDPACPTENLTITLHDSSSGEEIVDLVFEENLDGTSVTYVITDSESENSCWGTLTLYLNSEPPVAVCLNGLTTVLDSPVGELALWAEDFESGSFDPGGGNLTFGIRVVDDNNPDAPFEPFIVFSCIQNLEEYVSIELQATNEQGASSVCFTYLILSGEESIIAESFVDYGVCESNVDASITVSFVTENTNFDFIWTGPNGFTSMDQNISGLEPGLYILESYNASCAVQDSFIILEEDCLWPGDTNNDGIANNFDILNMGAAFGATGLARASATTEWVSEPALNWPDFFSNGLNYKYADADGSGLIDWDDLTVLENNYGSTFNYEEPAAGPSVDGAVPFYVEPIILYPNEAFSLPVILGAEDNLAEDITGVAFTITYDPEVIVENSVYIDALDSWLGEDGNTMFKIQQDNYGDGRLEIGLTRIDDNIISGFGQLCRLNIIIEDVIFLNAFSGSSNKEITYFNIENVRLLNSSGLEIETEQINNPVIILEPESTKTDELNKGAVFVYPNPAKDKVFIQSDAPVKTLEVLGAGGQVYLELKNKFEGKELDVSTLLPGIYYLKVETENGFEMRKLVIME